MVTPAIIRDTFVLLEAFEKGLNVVGYIPVLGTAAATIRYYYSNVELISGLAFAIFSLGIHLQGNVQAGFYFTIGLTLFGHAILNGLRSSVEAVPTLPLFTALPYDLYATYVVGKRFFSYV